MAVEMRSTLQTNANRVALDEVRAADVNPCCLIATGFWILAIIFLSLGYVGKNEIDASFDYRSLGPQGCLIVDIRYGTASYYANMAPKFRCRETWTYSFQVANNNTNAVDNNTQSNYDSEPSTKVYQSEPEKRDACNKKDCNDCSESDFWGRETFQGEEIDLSDEGYATECWEESNVSSKTSPQQHAVTNYYLYDRGKELAKQKRKNLGFLIVGWVGFALGTLAFLCCVACSIPEIRRE